MESKSLMLVLTIAQLILDKGIPAALKIIKHWEIEDPTLEDIQALPDLVKDPESYFNT